MKSAFKEYFVFSKKERVAIVILLMVVLVLTVAPWFMPHNPVGFRIKQVETDSFIIASKPPEVPRHAGNRNYKKPVKAELFPFDPNTISDAEWIQLGVREKTITTIRNFLSKGGRFYKPEDISKIYGLSPSAVSELIPFVNIKWNHTDQKTDKNSSVNKVQYEQSREIIQKSVSKIIEINSADSSDFESLPGIGPKLASRILLFREKLGGFYTIDQIGETFGLADSTFRKLRRYLICDSAGLRVLHINKLNIQELSQHPYIRYALAKRIIAYRQQHGEFKTFDDLSRLDSFEEQVFKKIRPYIVL